VLDLDGGTTQVWWDADTLPYVADVRWADDDTLLLSAQSRDQRDVHVLRVDPTTGDSTVWFADHDPAWVELVPGSPGVLPDGRLVVAADRDGARRVLVDGEPVTPAELQVRSIAAVGEHGITFMANPLDDATVQHVWRWHDGGLEQLTTAAALHAAAVGGITTVVRTASLDAPLARTEVLGGPELSSFAESPLVALNVTLVRAGERRSECAVLLPRDHDGSPLPVLMDPYAGPHSPRVVRNPTPHLQSQWFADQGFAVVVVDGRGTPGRGAAWERAIHRDLAGPVLDDQIDALHDLATRFPLDLSKVAIRGWSFGGYLAALAVLRRPDVFHAAVAGAPVTEWRLYDTHYTERYLGDPMADPEPYDRCSLVADAHRLERPLLLVHGLADDNVVAAHTLQLSAALLAAGRPHEVLPLVGVTHMTPQEVVAENLMLHQLEFLRRSLGLL
jgi:dipeptidyl-peptidase-4